MIQNILKTLRSTYKSSVWYAVITIAITALLLTVAIVLPNREFALGIITSSSVSFAGKLNILATLPLLFVANTSTFVVWTMVVSNILFGINVSLLVYYARKYAAIQKSIGIGTFGMIIGFLGVGCASCGSFVLSSLLGISATAGLLGFLPFQGREFSFLSIIIILISIAIVSSKVQKPDVCKIRK